MRYSYLPNKQGLYDPRFEHDSCGVGFVCDIRGRKSHKIIQDGLEVLRRLSHRGATGADPKTGDGAGILIQTPHDFFVRACKGIKLNLPNLDEYGTGLVFLPTDKKERASCKEVFAKIIEAEGQLLLGWRKVPVDSSDIGKAARETQPEIEQVFIARNKKIKEQLEKCEKIAIALGERVSQMGYKFIFRYSSTGTTSFFWLKNIPKSILCGKYFADDFLGFFREIPLKIEV